MKNMERRNLILAEVQDIFRKELDEPNLELSFESSAGNVEKWDSINNLILITEIEDHFDISFPIDLILTAKNVGDLCDYVLEHSSKV